MVLRRPAGSAGKGRSPGGPSPHPLARAGRLGGGFHSRAAERAGAASRVEAIRAAHAGTETAASGPHPGR